MASLKLQLLGQFRAESGAGGTLAIASKKGQALLAYLALTAGQRHSRDKLAMLLWSDRPDDRARHSLRQCVLTLRKVLGSEAESALLADDEGLSLDAANVEVDVWVFEQAVAARAPADLERAMALYGGDLLEDLNARSEEFEVWLRAERPRFRNLAVEALAALAEQQAGAGEAEAAIAACQRLLQLDPLHEPAHRLLMRLLTEQGRRAAALRQYQVCEEILRDELGAEPEAETRRLFDEIRSQSYEAAEEGEPPQVAAPAVSTPRSQDLSEGLLAAKRLWLTLLLTWRRSLLLLRAILSGARQGLVWVIVGAAGSLAVMGGVIWLVFLSGGEKASFAPVRPAEMALPLPKKPSIAVLPFETLGDHPEQADLSDGITGGITDALSIMSEMFVIAPGTAIQVETPVNLPETAKELGVRYHLLGSIQWSSDQVRVSTRLIDAVEAHQIWAARYDREIKEVFELQDEITQEIVTALQVQMTEGEQERIAFQHGTQNLEAWMLSGNGLKLLRRLTREDNVRARGLYRRAAGLDSELCRRLGRAGLDLFRRCPLRLERVAGRVSRTRGGVCAKGDCSRPDPPAHLCDPRQPKPYQGRSRKGHRAARTRRRAEPQRRRRGRAPGRRPHLYRGVSARHRPDAARHAPQPLLPRLVPLEPRPRLPAGRASCRGLGLARGDERRRTAVADPARRTGRHL